MKKMINVQWVETLENGNKTIKYENFLTDAFIDEFVEKLEVRGCTDIKIEEVNLD